VVDDLEMVQPVDAGQGAEEPKVQFRVVPQQGADLHQVLRLDLRPLGRDVDDGVGELLLDAADKIQSGQYGGHFIALPQPEGRGTKP